MPGALLRSAEDTFDILIIGAGLSGICSLYQLRKRFPSYRIRLLEAGSAAGGVWYWNRYPGARLDCEVVSYGFSFDKELLQEWDWKDEFSAQPDTLQYLQRVCEKNDLYPDMQFDTRIKSAVWDDVAQIWEFTDQNGCLYKTTFFVSCLGFLSAPSLPNVPGIENFKGTNVHTSRWPEHLDTKRDLAGKRIGVIGTGATAIQTITAISKEPSIQSLTVFQRTANWSAPLRNTAITHEKMTRYKAEYDTIFQSCAETPGGFLYQVDPRTTLELSEAERVEHWEKLYAAPGFGKWLNVFSDCYTDREANRLYSDFIAEKIRSRVHDPEVADSLTPKNHGFGTRRVPLESGYFEAFNQDNVHLVNVKKTPISEVTEVGIVTTDGKKHALDILIYATGFDTITGAFNAIKWSAKDGRPLVGTDDSNAIWLDHRPKTFLGMTVPYMPNTFMVLGPHQPFGNATRNIEFVVQVISDLLQHCKDNDLTYVEPNAEAVEQWTEHVYECGKGAVLVNEVDSWMTGVNTNVKGKTVRNVARYAGSASEYRKQCNECKANGWKGLVFA